MANLDQQIKESQTQVAEAQNKIAELSSRIEAARQKMSQGNFSELDMETFARMEKRLD